MSVGTAVRDLVKRALGRTPEGAENGEKPADWYDAMYQNVDIYAAPYFQSHYYFIWSVMADRIRRAGWKRVLDIGCGPGQLANCLFDLGGIESYTGLDFSAEAVRMATEKCPRGRFVVGDATTTTIHADVPHDVVISTEVLEHVPNDEAVLSRFRSGTPCLVTVPNFPYTSHVRHFEATQQVLDRYGPFFDRLDVLPLRGQRGFEVYYLCEGVKH